MERTCTVCGTTGPEEAFVKFRANGEKRINRCKPCEKARKAQQRLDEKTILVCTKCGGKKKATEFRRDKTRPTGRRSECRTCSRIAGRIAWTPRGRKAIQINSTAWKHTEAARAFIAAQKDEGLRLVVSDAV